MSRPSLRLLSHIASAIALSVCVSASAQTNKKPAPAPAKPAAKPAAPASSASHSSGGGTTSATHGTTTTASHGPTTSGATTHGPTTSGATTHGPSTTAAGGPHTAATAGRPGVAGARPAVADHGPMAHPGPAHDREVRTPGGGAVRMRPDGHAADFHDAHRGMDIHHNLGGGRRVMVERADHSHLMYERGRPGYIGHPYMYHGHEFARRAYYYNGRAYNRFYNPYFYHGVHFEVYAPYRYYSVGFYGWAYHPWGVPVAYAWGWGPSPWYGYYGGYFSPYPVYASPSLWLTDYMISASLQAHYEAAVAAGPPPPLAADAAPLTPDVKQMVADEVQRQLALENSEAQMNAQGQAPDPASSGIARMLSDGQPHTFVAGSEVDVVDASGQECAVTDGDVLQLTAPPAPDAAEAQVMVMSSKGGKECHKRTIVSVPLEELQEMQNHMRETVDLGLADLQAKQGKSGLPAAPPSAMAAPTTAAFAADAPAPEPGGDKELAAQAQQADQSEAELTKAVASGPGAASADGGPLPAPIERGAPAAPASIDIQPGQTLAEVKAALGAPIRIVSLGTKTIYVYKDMKITFKLGKVSDIE